MYICTTTHVLPTLAQRSSTKRTPTFIGGPGPTTGARKAITAAASNKQQRRDPACRRYSLSGHARSDRCCVRQRFYRLSVNVGDCGCDSSGESTGIIGREPVLSKNVSKESVARRRVLLLSKRGAGGGRGWSVERLRSSMLSFSSSRRCGAADFSSTACCRWKANNSPGHAWEGFIAVRAG